MWNSLMTPEEQLRSKEFSLNERHRELGGLTPVMYAAKHNLVDFISQQLEPLDEKQRQEVLSATTATGLTPLHLAALSGQTSAVLILLNLKAPTDCPSSLGFHPIHLMVKRAPSKEDLDLMFDEYVAKGHSSDFRTSENESIAHLAAEKNFVDLLKKIDPVLFDKKNNRSLTPLMVAVLQQNKGAISFLLQHSDLSIKNTDYLTAYDIAKQQCKDEVVILMEPFFCDHTEGKQPGFES